MKDMFDLPEKPYHLSADACLAGLQVQKERGLDQQEAERRLALFGRNILPLKKRRGIFAVFFSQFYSPLIALLLASGGIIWWIGKPSDAAVVFAVVILNAVMGAVQEGRAARSLDALRKLSMPYARVLRDGQEKKIDASDVVPGDILFLQAGDAVSTDMRIIESAYVEVNESALTGESHAVSKDCETIPSGAALYEQHNMLFSGTLVAKGRCAGVVTATGSSTQLGKIAFLAESGTPEKTPIEKKLKRFSVTLAIVALLFVSSFFLVGLLRAIPLSSIFMAAVSQLVSLIPEGLPVAITIALAVGVQRMAKEGALVRHLHAVETLGSTTVICTDKTGTLTKNEMTVTQISLCEAPQIDIQGVGYSPRGTFSIASPLSNATCKHLLGACILCNDGNIAFQEGRWVPIGDPMEAALIALAMKAGLDVEECRQRYARKGEIPFDSSHKMMMMTFHEGFALVKGALEEVLALSSSVSVGGQTLVLEETQREEITREAMRCAAQGKRILGFARILSNGQRQDQESFASIRGRGEWLGFVALVDPPREEVINALALCRRAHIRTIMLTGDQIATATAIGRELSIMNDGDIAVEGKELANFSKDEFLKKIRSIAVYARVQPEQKYRIVDALQQNGEVVAMTGDGINDAPALAKANVGVAMGTGTEVAKEAAKMVITDDNFATLVKAVEQGRLVYRNIVKVILYLLSTTFAAALVMLIAISLGYPLPLAAVQILWINVVTEGTVTINLVLDPPEGSEMDIPPLSMADHILSHANLLKLCWTIFLLGGVLFGYFLYIQGKDYPLEWVQTEMFTLLAFCAWFTLFAMRSNVRSCFEIKSFKNHYLTLGLLLSIGLQGAVIYNPSLNTIFHTVPLSLKTLLLLLGVGSLVLWVEELRKWILRHLNISN